MQQHVPHTASHSALGSRVTHFGNKGQRKLKEPARDVRQIETFPQRADASPAASPTQWLLTESITSNVPLPACATSLPCSQS